MMRIDAATPLRSPARYRALVRAIFEADPATQETHAVEWKREGDLGQRYWQAELSRQILGSANRDPEAVSGKFGGCGYILVGVSPGELPGTHVYDAAKIEAWITPYVGRSPAPEWSPNYVEYNGKQVLVLTVEPPQVGDQIWTCHRTYSGLTPGGSDALVVRDGAIYVRGKAGVEEATTADIEMLTRRLAGSRRRIRDISVLVDPSSAAASIEISDEDIAQWLKAERQALAPKRRLKPEPVMTNPAEAALAAYAHLTETAKLIADSFNYADPRTPDQFREEVETYLKKAEKAISGVVLRHAYERGLGAIKVSVRNDTDDPIDELQLELYLPTKAIAAFSEAVDLPRTKMPPRPLPFGQGRSRFDSLLPVPGLLATDIAPGYSRIPPIRRGVTIDNSGSSRLTFAATDLYPQETVMLDTFRLFANASLHAGRRLAGEWSARARNLSGVMRGTLEIPVDATRQTISDLLANPRKEK